MCLVHGWNLMMDADILRVSSDCCYQKRPFASAPFHIWGDLPEHATQGRPIGRCFLNYNQYVVICYCTDLDIMLFVFVAIVIASSCLCVCLLHASGFSKQEREAGNTRAVFGQLHHDFKSSKIWALFGIP